MTVIRQLMIVIGIYFLAEVVSSLLNHIIPGNILGMLILLVCLMTGIIKTEHIKEITNFFLENLLFFFVPAGVGIIASVDFIRDNWYAIVIICAVSTIVIFYFTAKTVVVAKKIMRR